MIEVHPAAELFPMMGDDELRALAEDIKSNGQQEWCVIYKGQLLDGRNRWKACELLGIEPETCERDDVDGFDPVSYVISHNLHRRHLTESQRSMVAAKLKKQLEGPAKEKQKAQGKRGSEGGRGKKKETLSENLREGNSTSGKASEQAAAMLNVSGRSVDHAATVLEKGSKELVAKVESGEVSVSRAATIAKSTPKAEQVEVAEAPKKERPDKTPLDHLKHWWEKASIVEQKKFMTWLES